MRSIHRHASVLVAIMVAFAATSAGGPAVAQSTAQTVRLVVDYGDGTTKSMINLPWSKGNTVLDALKAATELRHGISFSYSGSDDSALLTRIDDVQNQGGGSGRKNWQFWVNATYGDSSFAVFETHALDVIYWRFGVEEEKIRQ